jgi:hypothetical protein
MAYNPTALNISYASDDDDGDDNDMNIDSADSVKSADLDVDIDADGDYEEDIPSHKPQPHSRYQSVRMLYWLNCNLNS